jgi:segregation and condensation protein B
MLRLVKDDEVELDEALGDGFDQLEDMQEQNLQADADGTEGDADTADTQAEQPDGVVEADQGDAADSADQPSANLAVMEALLLSTHHPLTAGRLAELLDLPTTKPIRRAIKDLNSQYESTGRSFRIDQVAGGFQILTLPEFAEHLQKLHQREADAKLTKAALETLAIIAYKQPILRANIEAIRGVACGETVRSLMEKHLVKIAGRAEEPGRPILYGTTKRFLELFGLNSLKDLPQPDALKPVERGAERA